jgi:hypothetical protein
MTSKLLKCAFALILSAAAHAQNETRRVSARLVYFQESPGNISELFFNNNGEFVKCSPSTSVSGTPVACPVDATGKVVFTGTAAGTPVVATANVPASVSEALFFFLKNSAPGAAPTYQILVVDESLKSLPKGGSFLCNLAPKTARVSLGEGKYILVPGKPVFMKRPEQKDEYNMAALQVQTQVQDDEWKNLKDTMLRVSESERYFIFSYLEDGKRPAVKIYKQVVQEIDSPAAT